LTFQTNPEGRGNGDYYDFIVFTATPVGIPFSIGRPDCTTVTPDDRLPHGSTIDTVDFLNMEFDLSDREAVALMGEAG